ncbi:hypothetical protein ACLOJK_023805 [Asimina triloba]
MSLLHLLCGDMVKDSIVKLTDGTRRLEVELPIKLMVVYVLDEGKRINFCGHDGDLTCFSVKGWEWLGRESGGGLLGAGVPIGMSKWPKMLKGLQKSERGPLGRKLTSELQERAGLFWGDDVFLRGRMMIVLILRLWGINHRDLDLLDLYCLFNVEEGL